MEIYKDGSVVGIGKGKDNRGIGVFFEDSIDLATLQAQHVL